MSTEKLAQPIEELRQRMAQLLSGNAESPLSQEALCNKAIEELSTSVEELQAALEALAEQNEQLVAARSALEAERQRYRELFEFAPDGYLVIDASGIIQEANCAAAQLLGVSKGYLAGKPLIVFVADSERRAFYDELMRLSQMQQVQEWEILLQRREGEAFEAALSVAAVPGEAGAPVTLRVCVRDISARKQAQKKIHFQAHLLDAVEQAVIATDLEGKIIYWNRFAQKLYGWQSEEVIGSNILEVTPAQGWRDRALEILSALRAGESWCGEFVVQHRDGICFPAMLTNSPIYDDKGRLIGIVGISFDITERKWAETALRLSEARYRRLFESNIIGIFVGENGGKICDANEAFLKKLGYSKEDLVSEKIDHRALTPPEYRDLDERAIEEYKLKGFSTPYEKEYLRKDGSRVPVLVAGATLEGEAGTSIAYALDLSDRNRARDALRESEKRFRSIFERSAIGMAIAEREGRILESNVVLQEMLGYAAEELSGMLFADFTHPDDLATDIEFYKELIAAKRDSYQLEKRYIRKNGQLMWGRLTVWLVRNDEGEFHFTIGMLEDITQRKQAEEALRESEERLRLALDAGGMEIWDWNLLTGEVKWSENLEPMHGFASGIAGNWAILEPIHPEDRERVRSALATAIEEKSEYESEYRVIASNGSVRWELGKGRFLYDETGKAVRLVGVGVNITQRKQMEEQLQESNRKISNILESITDAFVAFDRDWRYTYVNREAGRQLQRDPEKLLGQCVWEEFPAAKNAIFYKECQRAIAEQIPVAFEGFFPSQNKWLEIHAYPASEGLAVYFQDVTDRKRIQEDQRQMEERLRLALEAANLGTWDWNLLSGEVIWSPNHERLFGLPPDSFEGNYQAFIERIHPEDRQLVEREVMKSLEEKREYLQEFRVIAPDGSLRWISAKGQYFYDESDRAVRMIGVCSDISDRKRVDWEREQILAREMAARAEAEAANRMKDEFLAIVSHELRSPLNPILGWAQLLRSRKMNEAAKERALEIIERNAKTQLSIIDDLLDVSRMIRGKIRLNVSSVDLVPAIQSAMDTVRSLAEAKNIQLELAIALSPEIPQPEPFIVEGDSQRLLQVVWNLLSNAIKFTPEGGRVEVRLSMEMESEALNGGKRYAHIQVIDTGKGINPEFLPYVFERFRQADSTITRGHGGLGLGLAIVRSLVELHGGSVWVTSAGENRGSTFFVKLPLKYSAEKPLANAESGCAVRAPDSRHSALSGLRVLVVDDLPDARDLLIAILEEYEAEALAVASASEAMEALERWQPDILVSDIGMPELDGYALIRQVRALEVEKGRQIPAVALTAYARDEDRACALAAGFQKHLPKPVEPAALARAIAILTNRDGIL